MYTLLFIPLAVHKHQDSSALSFGTFAPRECFAQMPSMPFLKQLRQARARPCFLSQCRWHIHTLVSILMRMFHVSGYCQGCTWSGCAQHWAELHSRAWQTHWDFEQADKRINLCHGPAARPVGRAKTAGCPLRRPISAAPRRQWALCQSGQSSSCRICIL